MSEDLENRVSKLEREMIEERTSTKLHVDSCPFKPFKELFDNTVDDIEKKVDEQGNNLKWLVTTLITVSIVLLGFLSTLQVSKLPKEDFKTYVESHEKHHEALTDRVDRVIEIGANNHKEVMNAITELKLDMVKVTTSLGVESERDKKQQIKPIYP